MKNYCCPKCGSPDHILVDTEEPCRMAVDQSGEELVTVIIDAPSFSLSDEATCGKCRTTQALRVFDVFAEHLLTVEELRFKYADAGGHPCYTFAWWQSEVAKGQLEVGYWEWVLDALRSKEEQLSGYYVRRSHDLKQVIEFDQLVPGHKVVGDLIWCGDVAGGKLGAYWADEITRIIPAWESYVLSWRA